MYIWIMDKMNPLILKLYRECDDTHYFIRFLDYVISSRYPRVKITLNDIVTEPTISGVIRVVKNKMEYDSLDAFYKAVSGYDEGRSDRVLKEICTTDGATLWSVLEQVKDTELLNFVDQKYRAFLVYKDLESRIAPCSDEGYVPRRLQIKWDSVRFYLTRSSIEDYTHTDIQVGSYEKFRFLSAYENDKCGENLWFYNSKEGVWVRLL
jgi:hypothetical protein